MRTWPLLVLTLAIPLAASADDTVWRWTDAGGVINYSNIAASVPREAVPVATRLIREVDRLPSASPAVVRSSSPASGLYATLPDEFTGAPVPRPARKHLRKIYDADRLRFGCYAGGFLYNGGWSHADDISPEFSCDRYLYGVDGWLNAARAELALREHGISALELYLRYRHDMAAANAVN